MNKRYLPIFLKNYFPYIIIFLASLLPFFVNISAPNPNGIFNLRDSQTPFDPGQEMKNALYLWNPNLGLGYPNYGVFLIPVFQLPLYILNCIFKLSLLNSEKIYLTLPLISLGIGAYYFLNNYLSFKENKENKISSLLGALFYMFNILTNQRFIGVPYSLFTAAIFPVYLVFMDKVLNRTNKQSLRYLLGISLISPLFLVILLLLTFIFFFYRYFLF